jgi:hypothetical protein
MNIENLSLTDFTSKELNWLYLMLEDKRRDSENKMEIIEKMDMSALKYDLWDHQNSQYNYCTQWLTKIDEAAKFVKTREIMQSSN